MNNENQKVETGETTPQMESFPIVIEVTNKNSELAQTNVEVLFPNRNASNNYGNNKYIEIKSASDGMTYNDIISYLNHKSITIGLTFITALINNNTIRNEFIVHSDDIHGNYRGIRIYPILDPYQTLLDCVCIHQPYELNNTAGVSGLKLKMLPCAKIQIAIYPSSMSKESNKKRDELYAGLPPMEAIPLK